MSSILKALIGSRVKVFTGDQGSSDEGFVEDCDDVVLVLKTKTDTLVIPIFNVRLIKLIR